ncbi:MAG: polysaccharide biosynthesis protein [Phycisphaerae bacterium SM23_30]|nr:MAG: polysaccharide biosynthesis protein [Phycisphaerae bacterium SM23_30]
MEIPLSSPDITQAEIEAVTAVLRTRHLSLGPKLGEFEKAFAAYIGRRYAVAVNSGTSALHLSLLALGIGPGDEVITTPFSFIATTNVILMVGARPVFVDIDPVTYNLNADAIAEKITDKTKALIPVEVFGNPAGVDEVYDLAQRHNLLGVEDSCEALGSEINGRRIGTFGAVSTFAFYPNKQMTTGEGGVILTDDQKLAQLCASLRNQGRDVGAGWLAHARLGYNYRISDINCVIGMEQLKRLDQMIAKRSRAAQWYKELLADEQRLILPAEPVGCKISWFVYVARLQDEFTQAQRDKLLNLLGAKGIGCSNYFTPIHLQPFITERLGTKAGDFPLTEKISQRTVALPFFNNLTRDQVETVCNTVKSSLNKL